MLKLKLRLLFTASILAFCQTAWHPAAADDDIPPLPDLPSLEGGTEDTGASDLPDFDSTDTININTNANAVEDDDLFGDDIDLPDLTADKPAKVKNGNRDAEIEKMLNELEQDSNPDGRAITPTTDTIKDDINDKDLDQPVVKEFQIPKKKRSGIRKVQKSYKGFNTQHLPERIYKKLYRRANSHLPVSITADDLDRYMISTAVKGNVDGLRAILDMGRDPNIQDITGNTPLMAAANAGQVRTTNLLLLRGADPNLKNKSGVTALHIAANAGQNQAIRSLLKMGADPDIQNTHGNTPLMYATFAGKIGAVRLLLINGADPNLVNNEGITALHVASHKGRSDIVSALVSMRADLYAKATGQGFTSEELAISSGSRDAARIIASERQKMDALIAKKKREEHKILVKNTTFSRDLDYNKLPENAKKVWDRRLADWVEADKNFKYLSEREKLLWNDKLKALEFIFKDHFTAKTPEDQKSLDKYMQKWRDLDPKPAKPAEEVEVTKKEKVSEKHAKLLIMLEEWNKIDAKFDSLSKEEKIKANEQRVDLIDKVSFDKITGEYAEEFAKLPEEKKEKFKKSMQRWDAFEDALDQEKEAEEKAKEEDNNVEDLDLPEGLMEEDEDLSDLPDFGGDEEEPTEKLDEELSEELKDLPDFEEDAEEIPELPEPEAEDENEEKEEVKDEEVEEASDDGDDSPPPLPEMEWDDEN